MGWNIHCYLSSNESLRKQRDKLEKDLGQNKDTKDSEWGILTERGGIKMQLSDVNEEIARRLSDN